MIANKDGLVLTGTICASNINKGNRKDDGTPYARRTAMISTGTSVVSYSETVDPLADNEPYELNQRVVIDVSYARTENNMISVMGELTVIKVK